LVATVDRQTESLVAFVREQQPTILELACRLGFLQAVLQQRDEQLKAFQALKEDGAPGEELAVVTEPADEPPDARRLGRWRRV
jgi:hypothetical protein